MALWIIILVFAIVFLIASLPLHFSVTFLGGESSILKAMVTNVLIGIIGAGIYAYIPKFAGILYFIAMLFIYKSMFSVGWIRSLLVWVLQGIIAIILLMLFMFLGVLAL